MKKRAYFKSAVFLLVPAAFAAFLVFAAAQTLAAPSKESPDAHSVKAEGIAVKSDDKPDFKKRALAEAYRVAVAEAALNILKEDDSKKAEELQGQIEAQILPNATNYILTYKVLSEGWMTHMDIAPPAAASAGASHGAAASTDVEAYHIRIEAGIDAVRLRGDLARLQAVSGQSASRVRISITYTDFADYNSVLAFALALKKVPQVKDVTYDSLTRGRVRFNAAITGDPQSVMNRIAKDLADDYSAAPTGRQTMQIKPLAKRGI